MPGRTNMDGDDERLSNEAFLHIARQQSESLKRIDQTLEKIRADGHQMSERLIRIETQDTKAIIDKIDKRLDGLEGSIDGFRLDKAKMQGAAGLVGWLTANYQGIAAAALAAYLVLKSSHVVP